MDLKSNRVRLRFQRLIFRCVCSRKDRCVIYQRIIRPHTFSRPVSVSKSPLSRLVVLLSRISIPQTHLYYHPHRHILALPSFGFSFPWPTSRVQIEMYALCCWYVLSLLISPSLWPHYSEGTYAGLISYTQVKASRVKVSDCQWSSHEQLHGKQRTCGVHRVCLFITAISMTAQGSSQMGSTSGSYISNHLKHALESKGSLTLSLRSTSIYQCAVAFESTKKVKLSRYDRYVVKNFFITCIHCSYPCAS